MKITHWHVAYIFALVRRAVDGVHALREEAALARRASVTAQLPRRSRDELRKLYLSPGPPDKVATTQHKAAGAVRHHERWFGHRATTAVAVCALLVFVVAIAR